MHRVKNARHVKSVHHAKNVHHAKSANRAHHVKSVSHVLPRLLPKRPKSNCQTKSCCKKKPKAPMASAHVAALAVSVAVATVVNVNVMPMATSLKAAKKRLKSRVPNRQRALSLLQAQPSALKPKHRPTSKLKTLPLLSKHL